MRRPFKGDGRRSQARNNGVRALAGMIKPEDMLFFLDGDIVVRPSHIEALSRCASADVILSYVWRLNQARSAELRERLRGGDVPFSPELTEHRKLWRYAGRTYPLALLREFQRITKYTVGQPWWPALGSGNFAVRYSAFSKVNGFDEEFVGWGSEDADLGVRLYATGCKVKTAFLTASGFHLWHPPLAAPRDPDSLKKRQAILKSHRPLFARWGLSAPKDQEAKELFITQWP